MLETTQLAARRAACTCGFAAGHVSCPKNWMNQMRYMRADRVAATATSLKKLLTCWRSDGVEPCTWV